MRVWIIRFNEAIDFEVAKSAEIALRICREYIDYTASNTYREKCIKELEESYAFDNEWFGCDDFCSAEVYEVTEQ